MIKNLYLHVNRSNNIAIVTVLFLGFIAPSAVFFVSKGMGRLLKPFLTALVTALVEAVIKVLVVCSNIIEGDKTSITFHNPKSKSNFSILMNMPKRKIIIIITVRLKVTASNFPDGLQVRCLV